MRAKKAPDAGNTLVGVMAAGVVLGALALGLGNLWTVFDRMSFDALIRQKAVFVLNGEMERLASLYTTSDFGAGNRSRLSTSGYTSVDGIPNSTSRRIYSTNVPGPSFTTTTASAFDDAETNVWVRGRAPPSPWAPRPRGRARPPPD